MSRASYDLALEENMARRLSAEPGLAKTTAEVLGRLRDGKSYEAALVNAVFQKWSRYPINFTDAYGFMLAYTKILTGAWRLARITVGDTPLADKETEGNNVRLRRLNPQFGAEFEGALEIFRKSAEESRQLNIFRKTPAAINIQACTGD